jgi:hypothetical protein
MGKKAVVYPVRKGNQATRNFKCISKGFVLIRGIGLFVNRNAGML